MSWVNIYEQPIIPEVDLDTDVVVYVPGYAIKGPAEPTLVNSTNFTSVFGESPYVFTADSAEVSVTKNKVLAGTREKSWLYAKGLVDAGLTVLYKRFKSSNVLTASQDDSFQIYLDADTQEHNLLSGVAKIGVRAKYFGAYYNDLSVSAVKISNGVSKIEVKLGSNIVESVNVSLNPEAENYFGGVNFSTIEFYATGTDNTEISIEDLCDIISEKVDGRYRQTYLTTKTSSAVSLSGGLDDFSVSEFETAIDNGTLYTFLKDTEKYPVSYITTGGYFVDYNNLKPTKVLEIANEIKACYAVDFANDLTKDTVVNYRGGVQSIGVSDLLDFSKGFQFVGADTFKVEGIRVVLPDSFGYFVRLGKNIGAGLPYWTPTANNSQGLVANALAATRPVDFELENLMISNESVSINPIITKKNVGYVIMGNRTLYPNDGVLGPQSFLNCQIVVNTVERSARRAANKLRIVSTNAETAFKNFRNSVEKTCDKLLTNGDGLAEYTIVKLPKTKPATIDIQIKLTVVEGIETFNIYVPYSLSLD
jgi:hypothetical protein